MKDNFFEKYLPKEQIYDDLTYENLDLAYQFALSNTEEGKRTLFIFDDVQKALKDECQNLFLSIVNNRRHARLNLMLLCQNYFSIPLKVRSGLTDLFIFKSSKKELLKIFEEHFELHKDKFFDILKHCFKKEHEFLYINNESQRVFSNWNELLFSNDSIEEDDEKDH